MAIINRPFIVGQWLFFVCDYSVFFILSSKKLSIVQDACTIVHTSF